MKPPAVNGRMYKEAAASPVPRATKETTQPKKTMQKVEKCEETNHLNLNLIFV